MRTNQQNTKRIENSGQCSTRWLRLAGKRYVRLEDDDIIAVARQLAARRIVATLDQPLHVNAAIRDYLALCWAGLQASVNACLYLDPRDQLIAMVEVLHASSAQGPGFMETVVKRALATQARSVVLITRRPGPVPPVKPGYQQEFRELRELLALIGVRVIGQLTVGDDGTLSVAERGSL